MLFKNVERRILKLLSCERVGRAVSMNDCPCTIKMDKNANQYRLQAPKTAMGILKSNNSIEQKSSPKICQFVWL